MRKLIGGAVAALALVSTGAAGAGGWATVGVSPMPPEEAGTVWKVDLRVLQHGRTPLEGVSPTVTIRNGRSGVTKTFSAKPTGRSGVYRAEVSFPSAGRWSYEVYDGFTQYGGARTHAFAPVTIAGGDASTSRLWTIGGVGAVGLALAVLIARSGRRRRRLEPALPAIG